MIARLSGFLKEGLEQYAKEVEYNQKHLCWTMEKSDILKYEFKLYKTKTK